MRIQNFEFDENLMNEYLDYCTKNIDQIKLLELREKRKNDLIEKLNSYEEKDLKIIFENQNTFFNLLTYFPSFEFESNKKIYVEFIKSNNAEFCNTHEIKDEIYSKEFKDNQLYEAIGAINFISSKYKIEINQKDKFEILSKMYYGLDPLKKQMLEKPFKLNQQKLQKFTEKFQERYKSLTKLGSPHSSSMFDYLRPIVLLHKNGHNEIIEKIFSCNDNDLFIFYVNNIELLSSFVVSLDGLQKQKFINDFFLNPNNTEIEKFEKKFHFITKDNKGFDQKRFIFFYIINSDDKIGKIFFKDVYEDSLKEKNNHNQGNLENSITSSLTNYNEKLNYIYEIKKDLENEFSIEISNKIFKNCEYKFYEQYFSSSNLYNYLCFFIEARKYILNSNIKSDQEQNNLDEKILNLNQKYIKLQNIFFTKIKKILSSFNMEKYKSISSQSDFYLNFLKNLELHKEILLIIYGNYFKLNNKNELNLLKLISQNLNKLIEQSYKFDLLIYRPENLEISSKWLQEDYERILLDLLKSIKEVKKNLNKDNNKIQNESDSDSDNEIQNEPDDEIQKKIDNEIKQIENQITKFYNHKNSSENSLFPKEYSILLKKIKNICKDFNELDSFYLLSSFNLILNSNSSIHKNLSENWLLQIAINMEEKDLKEFESCFKDLPFIFESLNNIFNNIEVSKFKDQFFVDFINGSHSFKNRNLFFNNNPLEIINFFISNEKINPCQLILNFLCIEKKEDFLRIIDLIKNQTDYTTIYHEIMNLKKSEISYQDYNGIICENQPNSTIIQEKINNVSEIAMEH